jgi:hypothetical protein
MNFIKSYQGRIKVIFLLIFLAIISVEMVSLVDLRSWEIYRNEEFGFEIGHPKGWTPIVKEIEREDGIKKRIAIISDELSFDISVSSLNEPLEDFFTNLVEAKIGSVIETHDGIYSIQEHLNFSGFIAVRYYSDHIGIELQYTSDGEPILVEIAKERSMGEAILRKEDTVFYFRLIVETDAPLERNKDIFKKILSTFKFIE